jgi:hypothetical protein
LRMIRNNISLGATIGNRHETATAKIRKHTRLAYGEARKCLARSP